MSRAPTCDSIAPPFTSSVLAARFPIAASGETAPADRSSTFDCCEASYDSARNKGLSSWFCPPCQPIWFRSGLKTCVLGPVGSKVGWCAILLPVTGYQRAQQRTPCSLML